MYFNSGGTLFGQAIDEAFNFFPMVEKSSLGNELCNNKKIGFAIFCFNIPPKFSIFFLVFTVCLNQLSK